MKKVILICSMTLLSVVVFSQQMDERLLKVYSEQELTEIKKTNIGFFNALVYGLDNATYVSDLPSGKELGDLKTISLPSGHYSFASLGLKIVEDANQYYKIDGTNKMLVVKSGIVLMNELKYKK